MYCYIPRVPKTLLNKIFISVCSLWILYCIVSIHRMNTDYSLFSSHKANTSFLEKEFFPIAEQYGIRQVKLLGLCHTIITETTYFISPTHNACPSFTGHEFLNMEFDQRLEEPYLKSLSTLKNWRLTIARVNIIEDSDTNIKAYLFLRPNGKYYFYEPPETDITSSLSTKPKSPIHSYWLRSR